MSFVRPVQRDCCREWDEEILERDKRLGCGESVT